MGGCEGSDYGVGGGLSEEVVLVCVFGGWECVGWVGEFALGSEVRGRYRDRMGARCVKRISVLMCRVVL